MSSTGIPPTEYTMISSSLSVPDAFINDIGNIYNIFPLNPSFVQIIRKLGTYDLYHLITRIRKFLCPGFIQFIVIHHFLAAVDQKIIIKPCSRWQTDECTFFDPVFCDIWEIDFFYRCGGSNTDDVTVFTASSIESHTMTC